MTDISGLEIPKDSVIVIHDRDDTLDEDAATALCQELNERYPDNLVVVFYGDLTMETMDEDMARSLLEDLVKHQDAKRASEGT